MRRLAIIAGSTVVVALVAASLFWWPDFEREEPTPSKAEPVSPSPPPSESYDVAYHLDENACERVDVGPLENYQSDDAWQSEFQDARPQIAEGDIGSVRCEAEVPLAGVSDEEPAYFMVGVNAFESNRYAEYKWRNPYPPDAPTEEIVEGFDDYDFGETEGCQNIRASVRGEQGEGELDVGCHTENLLVVVNLNGFPATSESEVDHIAEEVLSPIITNTLREL